MDVVTTKITNQKLSQIKIDYVCASYVYVFAYAFVNKWKRNWFSFLFLNNKFDLNGIKTRKEEEEKIKQEFHFLASESIDKFGKFQMRSKIRSRRR